MTSTDTDTYTITYTIEVTENNVQGLVFGKPSLDDSSTNKYIDGLSLNDIFNLISQDEGLMTILTNRQDTPEGAQSIFTAQSKSDAYAQELKTKSLNESVNYDKIQKIETDFTNNLQKMDIINEGKYPEIPALNTQLPEVNEITIENRIKSLIGVYTVLKNKIKTDNLFSVGRTLKNNNTIGLHLPDISEDDFNGKDKLLGLKSLLFFVAKTFMRIPIVLLVASLKEQLKLDKLKNYTQSNVTIMTLINRLIKDIYPEVSATATASAPESAAPAPAETAPAANALLLQAIEKNAESKFIYGSYNTQKLNITIDMLCYILLYIKKDTSNYDNLILFFCERLIYIITYWCGSPEKGTDTRFTGDIAMSSQLGYLHQSTVTETTSKKNKNLVSALQKIHNENEKLISFVKLRKGKTTMVPNEKEITETKNDGTTMNIRYSGIDDANIGQLTIDNKILQFRYTDTVKSLYKECDRVTKKDGSKITLYNKFNEDCGTTIAEPGFISTIDQKSIATANDFIYNHEFHAGPFTQIYNETYSNDKIVDDHVFQEKIYTKLTNNEPVCIIGYGASGSGKTSVLIKLQTPDGIVQEGILMLLSKKIGKTMPNCKVIIQEFGIDFGGTKFINDQAFEGEYVYNKDGVWGLSGGLFLMNRRKICTFGNMFDDIMYYMEHERNVAKTPNNPVSSRSHIIIHLTYSSTSSTSSNNKPPITLFICDLAGVENSFDCSNIGESDDEKFKTIPQKIKPEKICDGKSLNNPYVPRDVFGAHKPMVDTVIPFDPSDNDINRNKPLNTRLHYGNYKSNNQNLKTQIDVFIKKYYKTISNNTLMNDISAVSVMLPNFSYALSNLQFPLGNYCKAIKEYCVKPKSTEIELKNDKANNNKNYSPQKFTFTTPTENLTNFFSIITKLNELKLNPSTGTVTVTHQEGNNKYVITNATNDNDKCFTETQQSLQFYYKTKGTSQDNQDNLIKIDDLIEIHRSYIIVSKKRNTRIADYIKQMVNTLIGKNKFLSLDKQIESKLTIMLRYIYTDSYSTTLTENPQPPAINGFVTLLNNYAKDNTILNPNTKKEYKPTKLVTTQSVTGEGEENVTYTPTNDGITIHLGEHLLHTFNFADIFVDTSSTVVPVEVDIPFPEKTTGFCYKLNNQEIHDTTPQSLKNTYTGIQISAKNVIDNVFKKDTSLNNFITEYKSLLIELFNLKYTSNNIPPESENDTEIYKKLYPFVFYLKDNLLKINTNSKYNKFQLQILIEQLYFRNINQNATLPVLYDYYDDTLDGASLSNKVTTPTSDLGGGMSGGGNKESCSSRTAEGVYINESLKDMRKDIARHVMSGESKQNLPSFYSRCLPIQCNPEFKNCMGVDKYPNPKIQTTSPPTQKDGDLVAAIKSMCGSEVIAQKLVFCVFCVFNISEPPLVRDPPPVPYVDITKLQQYNEILENISVESFRDVQSILDQINAEVNALKSNEPFKMLGMNLQKVFDSFTNALKNNQTDNIRQILSKIIDVISTSNAATPIGTILFTDAVAKNFAQVNTCNVTQQLKFNDYKYTADAVDDKKPILVNDSVNQIEQNIRQNNKQSNNSFSYNKSSNAQKQTSQIDEKAKAEDIINDATKYFNLIDDKFAKNLLLISNDTLTQLTSDLKKIKQSLIPSETKTKINDLIDRSVKYNDPKYYKSKTQT